MSIFEEIEEPPPQIPLRSKPAPTEEKKPSPQIISKAAEPVVEASVEPESVEDEYYYDQNGGEDIYSSPNEMVARRPKTAAKPNGSPPKPAAAYMQEHSGLASVVYETYEINMQPLLIRDEEVQPGGHNYKEVVGDSLRKFKLPIRWTAPEMFGTGILTLPFNEKTDVWAFGITAHEIFSDCVRPYPTLMKNTEVEHNVGGSCM